MHIVGGPTYFGNIDIRVNDNSRHIDITSKAMNSLNIIDVRVLTKNGFSFDCLTLIPVSYKDRQYFECHYSMLEPSGRATSGRFTTMRGRPWRMSSLDRALAQLKAYFPSVNKVVIELVGEVT